jgi:predicted metal-binding membrane protein
MTPAARERSQVRVPMLFISAVAWILLVVEPGGAGFHTRHSGAMLGAKSWKEWASGWTVMVAAMMVPLLVAPVRHVRNTSFARRRVRAIALFVAGYAAVWMMAGVVLLPLTLEVRLAAADPSIPLTLAAMIAFLWQCSPVKQRCLNRAHAHQELAAFGPAADIDALGFGLRHGIWCVGSCWALMLLPLLVSSGHVASMVVVSVWLVGERLDRPMPPRWCLRGPGKAARIAVAQAQARLASLGLNRSLYPS